MYIYTIYKRNMYIRSTMCRLSCISDIKHMNIVKTVIKYLHRSTGKTIPVDVISRKDCYGRSDAMLKLVRTHLNNRVLGTSTADISFQMFILFMHLYISDGRHA